MNTENYTYGLVTYKKPRVTTLFLAPIGLAEIGAVTCYKSHATSENEVIVDIGKGIISNTVSDDLHDAKVSKVVEHNVHANHHESIIEHITCSFLIQDVNRAILQEIARHRIGVSLSGQSTRYTVNDIIKLFFWSEYFTNPVIAVEQFVSEAKKLGMFALDDKQIVNVKLKAIYEQMSIIEKRDREHMLSNCLSKAAISITENVHKYSNEKEFLLDLQQAKNKRNAGDTLKSVIVDEMFSVDLVMTMNLRSLKHFLNLRDSGAAWYPIQVLAQEIKKLIPEDYLRYIEKQKKSEG